PATQQKPDEYFREVSRDDDWVKALLCAEKLNNTDRTLSGNYATNDSALTRADTSARSHTSARSRASTSSDTSTSSDRPRQSVPPGRTSGSAQGSGYSRRAFKDFCD
ncbi:hypothetical protein, partial [Microcoleus sp.]|uniref:hypothetical protein n=1 Tax=Microcoleus sp. TaxID=44472 RepID=UPI00359382E9